jgi:hypothetical protein
VSDSYSSMKVWPRRLSDWELEIVTGWNCLADTLPKEHQLVLFTTIHPDFTEKVRKGMFHPENTYNNEGLNVSLPHRFGVTEGLWIGTPIYIYWKPYPLWQQFLDWVFDKESA